MMFHAVVKKVRSISDSRVVVNILYVLAAMIVACFIMSVPVILSLIGIEYQGDNFMKFLLQYLFIFSLLFFVNFRRCEKKLFGKNKTTI